MSWLVYRLFFGAALGGGSAFALYRSADRIADITARLGVRWSVAQYLATALRVLGLVGMILAVCFGLFLGMCQFLV